MTKTAASHGPGSVAPGSSSSSTSVASPSSSSAWLRAAKTSTKRSAYVRVAVNISRYVCVVSSGKLCFHASHDNSAAC